MRARWYDPTTARWLSKDLVWDGTNRYAFVGNQFTTHVDYNGLETTLPVSITAGSRFIDDYFSWWRENQQRREEEYHQRVIDRAMDDAIASGLHGERARRRGLSRQEIDEKYCSGKSTLVRMEDDFLQLGHRLDA